MTPDDRRARLQRILDEHDRVIAELQESQDACRESTTYTRRAADAARSAAVAAEAAAKAAGAAAEAVHALAARVADTSAASNKAITFMLAANRAATALLNDEAP